MRELDQIRAAVLEALEDGGLTVTEHYGEERAGRCTEAIVTAEVSGAADAAMGFCNYLGERYDAERGTVLECYGKQVRGEIRVEVRAEYAAECERACACVSDVLRSGLPDGIDAGELAWEAICWEKSTEAFLRRGTLRCTALFLAQSETEAETFLDFRLKGAKRE
ncbi:MAG: hypothetical protein IKN53_06515 [Oscillibacter sp.]|nr:hypothetical protein [Oscillibacter sp.]